MGSYTRNSWGKVVLANLEAYGDPRTVGRAGVHSALALGVPR